MVEDSLGVRLVEATILAIEIGQGEKTSGLQLFGEPCSRGSGILDVMQRHRTDNRSEALLQRRFEYVLAAAFDFSL